MTELLEPMDDIDLAVVDVDSNIELVKTFEVKAVPAVLAFRNGVVVDKFIGLVDSTMIENLISKLKKKKGNLVGGREQDGVKVYSAAMRVNAKFYFVLRCRHRTLTKTNYFK